MHIFYSTPCKTDPGDPLIEANAIELKPLQKKHTQGHYRIEPLSFHAQGCHSIETTLELGGNARVLIL